MKFNSIPNLQEEFETLDNSIAKHHITIIKWIAVTLILSAFAIPTIIISTVHHPVTHDIPPHLNQTACVYVKQYPLQDSTFVTVCNTKTYIFVDIRKFINGSATKIGIHLQKWEQLQVIN